MPEEFFIYRWRKWWQVGYLEAMRTPLQAMRNDFEMADIEADHAAMRQALKQSEQ